MKMLYYDTELHNEQLSVVLKNNVVITFQENHGGDAFYPIRKRLKEAKGRVRKCGPIIYVMRLLMLLLIPTLIYLK
jgi:cytochrome c-type biogenesis protein CcmH/NrfG